MERGKLGCNKEEERGKCSRISINGKDDDDDDDGDQNAEVEAEAVAVAEGEECLGHHNNNDEELMRKKEISCHSLYGLLVKSHLDCLKMCVGVGEMEKTEFGEVIIDDERCWTEGNLNEDVDVDVELISAVDHHQQHESELDEFMETYCKTLKKVKEAIQEPQEESLEFINLMYSQLHHLSRGFPNPPPPP